jgi:predicted helicase
MIVVRNTFTAKPGCASKLAAQFKDANVVAKIPNARVMTDIVGGFNTVILEYEAKDLQDFEATMRQYETDQAFREKMKGYTELYSTGKREIFKIV